MRILFFYLSQSSLHGAHLCVLTRTQADVIIYVTRLGIAKKVGVPMIHYCKHCGTLLEKDAKVCPFCGKTVELSAPKPEPTEPPVAESAPVQKAAPKKLQISAKALLIGIGVITFAMVIAIVIVCVQYFAPIPAVERFEALKNKDYDVLESLAPAEFWEAMAPSNQTAEQYIDKRKDYLKRSMAFTSTGTLKFDIVDREATPNEDLDRIKDILQEHYGISPNRVKVGQNLILKVTQSVTDSLHSVSEMYVIAIQIDSTWYLWSRTSNLFLIHNLIEPSFFG